MSEKEFMVQLFTIQEELKSQSEKLLAREKDLKEREKELKEGEQLLTEQFNAVQEMEGLLDKRKKKLQEKEKALEEQEKTISAERERFQGIQADLERKCEGLMATNDDLTSQVILLQSQMATNSKAKKRTDERFMKDQLPLRNLTYSIMHWLTKLQLQASTGLSPLDKTLRPHTLSMSLDVFPDLVSHMTLGHMTPTDGDSSQLLTVLEFAHLNVSILSEEQHRSAVTTSLRRLGELVEKVLPSEDVQVDILCSLIGLQTISQVDKLAGILERLMVSLRSSKVQQLFLMYRGMDVMFSLLKNERSPPVLVGKVLEMLIAIMPEPVFIERCTTRDYYNTLLSCMRRPSFQEGNLEKMSILLQRMSRNRSVCNLLVSLNGVQTIKLCLVQHSSNSFVLLNFKSILSNIENNTIVNM